MKKNFLFGAMSAFLLLTAFQCGSGWDNDDTEASIVGSWEYQSCQEHYYYSWPTPGDTILDQIYPPVRDVLFEAGNHATLELESGYTVYPPHYFNSEFEWSMSGNSDTVFLSNPDPDFGNYVWEILELTNTQLVVRYATFQAGPESGTSSVYTTTYRRR